MKAPSRNMLLFIAIFVVGFVSGFVCRPRIMDFRIEHKQFDISCTSIVSDTLYDICSGKRIALKDTLSYKSRNLLVFWSPTCKFCKEFFLHKLNEKLVGIYCFPLTNDLEYLKFYVDNHNIKLPQLMTQKFESFVPVEASSIVATPTFIIIDNKGKRLNQYIGINELDEMIAFLYQ